MSYNNNNNNNNNNDNDNDNETLLSIDHWRKVRGVTVFIGKR